MNEKDLTLRLRSVQAKSSQVKSGLTVFPLSFVLVCKFQIINFLQFPSKTPNTVHENTVPGLSRLFKLKSLGDKKN